MNLRNRQYLTGRRIPSYRQHRCNWQRLVIKTDEITGDMFKILTSDVYNSCSFSINANSKVK